MKSNELRIGNLVCLKHNQIITVELLDLQSCGELNSIPLTEEWLLKFGFDYLGDLYDCNIYKKGIIIVSIIDGFFTFSLKRDKKSNYVPLVEFKHVHQLQNLYFALTGEELTN